MIRPYRDEDLDELLDAWYSASRVGHPFLEEGFLERERRKIATVYLPDAETWVFELDGAVVGFISLIGDEVGAIFVDAGFHGRGIGRALMDHARSVREVLELDVFEANRVGRRFYDRYGFVTVGGDVHEETGFKQLRLRLVCD